MGKIVDNKFRGVLRTIGNKKETMTCFGEKCVIGTIKPKKRMKMY